MTAPATPPTTPATSYPKRLIEVDLPIRRISAHARREKSIRHGHISTLHIWWARRPLAACRAVICAALWPDTADPYCPPAFRTLARERMRAWADLATHTPDLHVSPESFRRFSDLVKLPARLEDDDTELRASLLDFIADFANWDNSTNPHYLDTARALTQAAHEALGGEPGTRPLVVDPFAGGGAIPLEALRVGADAFASDLNPVAVLLNKVVLEYIPKYGQRLADEVRRWGQWIKEQAERGLAEFYPKDPDGATPIAYLWARTIRCEGPSCGAEVPLIRSLWLAKRGPKNSVALRLIPNATQKRVDFEIIHNATPRDVAEGTVRKGSATCPVCGYTTPVASVRRQLKERRGGSKDARLIGVVRTEGGEARRSYRVGNSRDIAIIEQASLSVKSLRHIGGESASWVPNEPLPPIGTLGFRVQLYGMSVWSDLFAPRQLLTLVVLSRLVRSLETHLQEPEFSSAVQSCLALALGRLADRCSSLCTWDPSPAASGILHTFGRQALPFIWDFAEGNPFEQKSGGWLPSLEWVALVASHEGKDNTRPRGVAMDASATNLPLPDHSAAAYVTDPPYYDAVPYADLSDFFYVWLKRCLPSLNRPDEGTGLTPKTEECTVDAAKGKDYAFFQDTMMRAMSEGHRTLAKGGIGIVVFAHKSTSGWEAQLQAMVDAGWSISGSWPIDTEMGTRLRAHDSAALASSIHLVCRPRDPSPAYAVGDWRDVLDELPRRIHAWLPRLIEEGIVGADAIFACLGPAVEIFSRYQRVEKANGDPVTLRDYLPHVWAAVSREALRSIFEQADATGFEEDARLTALWLWTLFGGQATQSAEAATNGAAEAGESDAREGEEDDDETPTAKPAAPGGAYVLEFDAARKIAQGLGAHLDRLPTVVAVKGDKARLLPVAERARHLFGNSPAQAVVTTPRARRTATQMTLPGVAERPNQTSLDDYIEQVVADAQADTAVPEAGATVLDRLHQSMLLFAGGRTAALRRFLVEDGIGRDERFWRLAQALSALYPMGSDEKRWVDGVLARKKGWGL